MINLFKSKLYFFNLFTYICIMALIQSTVQPTIKPTISEWFKYIARMEYDEFALDRRIKRLRIAVSRDLNASGPAQYDERVQKELERTMKIFELSVGDLGFIRELSFETIREINFFGRAGYHINDIVPG